MNAIRLVPCVGLLCLLPLMSGCAAFVRASCQSTDWHESGRAAGAEGSARSALAAESQRCGEVGVAVPEQLWKDGWREGHAQYCSVVGGRYAGAAGKAYTGVCKGAGAAAFARGYDEGLAGYCPQAGVDEGTAGQAYDAGVCAGRHEAAYAASYRAGLRSYCSAGNGWRVGREGRSYRHVCPGHLEGRFLEHYRAGERARALTEKLERNQNDRESLEKRIAQANPYDTDRLVAELRQLEREASELTRQLTVVEARYLRF